MILLGTIFQIYSLLYIHHGNVYIFRLEFIGRLDTWNTNWMEIESMRSELKGCNLNVTLWELFDSQSRQEGALRGIEQNRNGVQADENVHGAEYVE